MLNRRCLQALVLICVAGCSKGRSGASPSTSASAPSPTADSVPVTSAPSANPPDVPAKVKIDADGITLIETTTGSVVVKTTTLWNAPLEVTYESCEYYVRAIPVMERQVDPKRGAHFKEVCKDTKPPEEKPPDAKAGTKKPAAKSTVVKTSTKPAASAQ